MDKLTNIWTGAGVLFVVVGALLVFWPEIAGECRACKPDPLRSISPSSFVRVDQSTELETHFPAGNSLAELRNTNVFPRVYAVRLPTDLSTFDDASRRKRIFVLAILPQILRLNEAVTDQRNRVKAIWEMQDSGTEVPREEVAWLGALEARHNVTSGARGILLRRLDVVPPSLVLAQAAVESGWGTSRFAQHGNTLFGQRTFDEDGRGLDPAGLENPGFRVKQFRSVMRSIWGYMLTLNSHPAYQEFRTMRERARAEGISFDSFSLAETLVNYSEERGAYVRLLRQVIVSNRLRDFDRATLGPRAGT